MAQALNYIPIWLKSNFLSGSNSFISCGGGGGGAKTKKKKKRVINGILLLKARMCYPENIKYTKRGNLESGLENYIFKLI